MFFEKKSPLRLKYVFPCTTGQIPGDKQSLNDLRTPEGIYFVEYKIANGLDFREYGGIAYTLNYPNPVDKLRGKTGHGIWIHSKGFGIEPLSTRGCVAIGLKEIDEVGPQLTPGTAVVLAETMAVGNPCLNWHYGVRRAGQGYASPFRCLDDLRHMPLPNKTRGISVLCSDKTATEAQRRRLELVGLLRERLGDTLEVFGRGFNPVDDKMTAIAPYKYHLVLENNYLDNFWTEKLTDAWLGWSLPLYLGAPNLGAASPAPGFIALPPGEPEACARIIAQTVSDGLWEKRREAIAACRHWAIETTNVFFRAASIMQEAPPRAHRLPALEQPEPIYGVGREAVSSLYRRNRA